eukprot:GHVL01036687.1.p1 GENE.GHVL01036687.1~~GHVL01036687.1.p1  ORF type:complete len:132 (-),score=24.52 GHVL01036687.1:316-711(-)
MHLPLLLSLIAASASRFQESIEYPVSFIAGRSSHRRSTKDSCYDEPCIHGTCKVVDDVTFECTCLDGWEPPTCEERSPEIPLVEEAIATEEADNTNLYIMIGGGATALILLCVGIYFACCQGDNDEENEYF